MQPLSLTARRVALCVLFVFSLVAIVVMNSGTFAADSTEAETAALSEDGTDTEDTLPVQTPADDKVALYGNYVQISGVSTEEKDGVVLVPVRFFAEAMCDCRIEYTKKGLLTVETDGLSLSVKVGDPYIIANDRCLYIGTPIEVGEDGQIWLPCDLMAKVFGCEYIYDADARSVYLTASDEYILPAESFYNEKDLYWLSRIISAESRGEPFYGQLAVGTVVLNRVGNSRFPNNIHDVVFDGRQFSPAYSGTVYQNPAEISVLAAKAVLEGYRVSENILFFHTAGSGMAGFVNNEEEMVIGHHYFYTVYGR